MRTASERNGCTISLSGFAHGHGTIALEWNANDPHSAGDRKMKNRIFVSLLLSTFLTLPGLSQQSNSNSSADTPVREPLKPTTSVDFWDGDDPNVVNLITHPFASKKYVRRQTQPIRDRIAELYELTATSAKTIKDVDSRAQQGIQMASEKTSLADQHATDATNKAEMAKQAATQASMRVSNAEQMVGNLDQYKAGAQTEIRFRPGQTVLSKAAKDALDEMAAPLKSQRSYIIEVTGFAAGRGHAAIATSQRMADSVVRYLVLNHQIPVYRSLLASLSAAVSYNDVGATVYGPSAGPIGARYTSIRAA
jgi:outer membrane protein OmpA-like peptidoglycan-associated protein